MAPSPGTPPFQLAGALPDWKVRWGGQFRRSPAPRMEGAAKPAWSDSHASTAPRPSRRGARELGDTT